MWSASMCYIETRTVTNYCSLYSYTDYYDLHVIITKDDTTKQAARVHAAFNLRSAHALVSTSIRHGWRAKHSRGGTVMCYAQDIDGGAL